MKWLTSILNKKGYFDPKILGFMALAAIFVIYLLAKLSGELTPILELDNLSQMPK